jgi:hypothetical protein
LNGSSIARLSGTIFISSRWRSLSAYFVSIAIEEPFKYEEDEDDKRIYVPPFWHLNTVIQKAGAWEGLENDEVYKYCKAFWSMALRFTNKKYYPILKPIKAMLKDRETRSDEILKMIKRRGYDAKEEVPEEVLKEIVLSYSSELRKDIENTRDLMQNLTEGDRVWL